MANACCNCLCRPVCFFYHQICLCETEEESKSERKVDIGCCFGYLCLTRIMPAKYYVQKRFPRSAVLLFIISTVDLVFLAMEWNNIYYGLESLLIISIGIGYLCVFQLIRIINMQNPKPQSELVLATKYIAYFGSLASLGYIVYASYLAATRSLPNAALVFQSSYSTLICLLILAAILRKYDQQLEREIQEADFVRANQLLKQQQQQQQQNQTSLLNPLLTSGMNHTNAFTVAPIRYEQDTVSEDRIDVEKGVGVFVSSSQGEMISDDDEKPVVAMALPDRDSVYRPPTTSTTDIDVQLQEQGINSSTMSIDSSHGSI